MKQPYKTGVSGERLAEQYLCALGMHLVNRRYRGSDGEIDLIMQDGNTIVFVEVKSRPASQPGTGLIAITSAKQRRMTHAAMAFLYERELTEYQVRFDAVEISRNGILHIPNAFMTVE